MVVILIVGFWLARMVADLVRKTVTLTRVEAALTKLMKTRFRFIVTEVGGCAVDVDTEEEYDVIAENFESWRAQHDARAEAVGGSLPLEAASSSGGSGA